MHIKITDRIEKAKKKSSNATVPLRNQFRGIDGWGPKKFKNSASGFSPFTHSYVLRRTLVAKAEMYCGKDRAA
jgi:hypothetical protein